MRFLLALPLALVLLLLATATARADEAPHPSVYLYTIGPSPEFPSRLGHAILCVRQPDQDTEGAGRCYDYGVADSEDIVHIGWTSMRDIPSFVPIMIGEDVILKFFKGQGRAIERQKIPLNADETNKLTTSIEHEVYAKQAYAYHPYWANCTTKLRDHLDDASGGKLKPGPSTLPPGTLRELFEEGHSGRMGTLTAMAIYLGEGNDVTPTPWQAMLLPAVLRDAVTERFGAQPEKVAERMEVIVPTSRALGRIVLFFVAFALFLTVRLCARKNRLRLARGIVGSALGVLAITIELAAILVKWPEIAHNWALLLFLPTDFALPFLSGKRLSLYLKVRIGMAVALAVLEIANVAHQPMLPLVALVIFPFAGLLSALKDRTTDVSTEAAPSAV